MTCLLYENRISFFSDTPQLNSDQAASIIMLSRPTKPFSRVNFTLDELSLATAQGINCNRLQSFDWLDTQQKMNVK